MSSLLFDFTYNSFSIFINVAVVLVTLVGFVIKGNTLQQYNTSSISPVDLWSSAFKKSILRSPKTLQSLCSFCIYIIIAKNIRYLLWNRGAWRFFHDKYLTIEVQGIRCTNHLHDSYPLTDVNPHFTAPGCRYYFKINSWWPIVTPSTHRPAASYCDVTMIHCSHGYLWTHDVEVDAS